MALRLRYIGKQEGIRELLGLDPRMWNIVDPSSIYNGSTRMLEGLRELNIVPNRKD